MKKIQNIFLSVIIPCYNEERNIRLGALENVAHFLRKKNFSYEVVIVNDGSVDESVSLVKDFIKDHDNFRLLDIPHQGKSGAVTSGVLSAKGEIVLFTDLDQATPITQTDIILPYFRKGFDIVIGSRNRDRKGAPVLRLLMARGFMILRNLILNLGIKDTQCGFKAFRREAARELFPKLLVFASKRKTRGSTVSAGFDVELLYLAKQKGYAISEVPVEWHYQETRHVNPVKDSLESLIDLIRIRWNTLKGVYS